MIVHVRSQPLAYRWGTKAVTYHEPTVMCLFMIGHSLGRMGGAGNVIVHVRSHPLAYGGTKDVTYHALTVM